jgi:hypothetical protein
MFSNSGSDSAGYYNGGYVTYLSGNQSLSEVQSVISQMREVDYFEQEMLTTAIEVMFYNPVLAQLLIITYEFIVGDAGNLMLKTHFHISLPD